VIENRLKILSVTKLYPTKCTFQQCIDYVDVIGRSSARGSTGTIYGRKWRFSSSVHEDIANGKYYGHG